MSNPYQDSVKALSIENLFTQDGVYSIPLYQRNFAWGKSEVKQLIRDIADFSVKKDKKYYLGILVVYERYKDGQQQFEVVDGQQRLTVLLLIMKAFENGNIEIKSKPKNANLDLNFAHRPKAKFTLSAISNNNLDNLDEQKLHNEIQRVYDHIPIILNEELEEVGCSPDQFYEYLCEKVVLYRSPLPSDTELNHYFEVMNNRGEQLEKHEILKAKLMNTVNDSTLTGNEKERARKVINQVWEACSDMNRYVQYSFAPKYREPLFGQTWNTPKDWFNHEGFDALSVLFKNSQDSGDEAKSTIEEILKGEKPGEINSDSMDGSPDTFQPVINFPNFLIQVLRIYQHKFEDFRFKTADQKYASLDDKVLLDQFINYQNDIEFVKRFVTLLLKLRFLLDQYVIKRQYEGDQDNWSLLKLNYYYQSSKTTGYIATFGIENGNKEATNKKVLMLLTMFHVSTPTQNYKHWLTGVLNYLANCEEIHGEDYSNFLENLARKLFFDRFMIADKEKQAGYDDIVFKSIDELNQLSNHEINTELLKFHQVKNNLVFNYLDYLLWKDNKNDERIKNFEFKFRSSVEHFNPRNPREHKRLDESHLNSFGNLCLIAHGKNSSFGNNNPLSKAYSDTSKTSLDSLKLHFMMKKAKKESSEDSKYGGWGPEQVESHQQEMISKYEAQL